MKTLLLLLACTLAGCAVPGESPEARSARMDKAMNAMFMGGSMLQANQPRAPVYCTGSWVGGFYHQTCN